MRFGGWQVDNDQNLMLLGELPGPAKDVFLNAGVEIPLAKRQGVERLKDLPDLSDLDLNGSFEVRLAPRARTAVNFLRPIVRAHCTLARVSDRAAS